MKRITDTINLDRVQEASSASDICSLWVLKSPQAEALAQQPALASVTKTTNRPLPWHIALWSIGSHTVLLYQIHSDDYPLLLVKNGCAALLPFDIKNSPGFYCISWYNCLLSHSICLPPSLPPSFHLLRNQTLLLRLNFSKAPVSSSPCLHLALICSHSFLAAVQFHQPEFLSSTFGVESLLWGSQSNNTALEAKAIIKSNALTDLTSLFLNLLDMGERRD